MKKIDKILKIRLKDIVMQYILFRWVLITLYLFSLIALLRYTYIIGIFKISYLFDDIWLHYCFEYWRTNPIYLFSIGIFTLIISFGIGWRKLFIETFQFLHIPVVIYTDTNKFVKNFFYYFLPFFVLVFLSYSVFPAIHLAANNALVLFVIQVLSVSLITIRFLSPMLREYLKAKKPLSNHTYDIVSYNTSSLGRLSVESLNEQKAYEIIEKVPSNHFALLTGQKDYPNLSYKGFKSVFTELSKLVEGDQIKGNFHNDISLHGKTTTAFKHIMDLVIKQWKKVEIICADTDYGTITEAINSYNTGENIHRIEIKDDIFKDGFSLSEVNLFYLKKLKDKNIHRSSKLVVVLTHVLSESGLVLDNIPQLVKDIKSKYKNTVIIIDGAQALGNIQVSKEILQLSDFYISCGHKWLLGSKTRGIVFYNSSSISEIMPAQELFEKSRSFSYFNYNPNQRSDETVSLNPDVTLVSSLKNINSINGGMATIEEHNTFLADSFRSKIYGKSFVKLIPPKTKGGILTIMVERKYRISENLSKYNIEFEEFDNGEKIRFSFHFYMGIKHVNKLVYILDDITNNNNYN